MEPIKPPKTIKIYQLIRQNGMSLMSTGPLGVNNLGTGFYSTLQEAEYNRTLEILKDTTSGLIKPKWHIWELDIPNPIIEEL
jgi:hypothetical protein